MTFILSILAISAIVLMLYAAVALVQDKRRFGSAADDIRAVGQPKPERFRGRHLLEWGPDSRQSESSFILSVHR